MDYNETKEQLKAYMQTLKLTEKKYAELCFEVSKWENRVKLARDSGQLDLLGFAEVELSKLKEQQQVLAEEKAGYESQITKLRFELPILAAQVRSVDTTLLEQELLIAGGYNPGEEEKIAADKAFAEAEKKIFLENALASLKQKNENER